MKIEFLIINILIFITGFLLGKVLEKRKCQKKITQILDEAVNEIYKVREVDQ